IHVEDNRPRIRDLARPDEHDLPAISIAYTEGIVVALASRNPDSPIGIDIEPIRENGEDCHELSLEEAEFLGLPTGPDVSTREWTARFRAAREAAAKAIGLGPAGDPNLIFVTEADANSGVVSVALRSKGDSGPQGRFAAIRVGTARRGEHVWAWALGKGGE